jgi:starch phosphorylase
VDVWLNNPRRPLEASGTSGMKAAANGGLNLSIADGWWPEASDRLNGWTIADGRVYDDQHLQDQFDSATLYRLLEEEVVPSFFERDAEGLPRRWLQRMRQSLRTIPPVFNTDRMVAEYHERAYRPLGLGQLELARERRSALKALVHENQRIRKGFGEIKILSAQVADLAEVRVGDAVEVRIEADLGPLAPEDVAVELVLGHAQGDLDLRNMHTVTLDWVEGRDRRQVFEGSHRMRRSGSYAYGIRVRPRRATRPGDSLRDLVLWA